MVTMGKGKTIRVILFGLYIALHRLDYKTEQTREIR